ncbi:MAG: hypothetical protein WD826_11285, partial [Actinomycetota bacterium]
VPATPRAECGPGSLPETGAQGRVPKTESDNGRAEKGYRCNAVQVSHHGEAAASGAGGYKVERYTDKAGHDCAYYDTTLLFPTNAQNLSSEGPTGVFVLDMSDPSKPVKTSTLVTPAMQSPHESLSLNQKRGLLVAVTANPVFYPGVVDVYDVTEDCRFPVLKASAPVGFLGHESGFAPDGKTFYAAALHYPSIAAIDLTNPSVPTLLGVFHHYSHGITVSDDGNRLYIASNDGRSDDPFIDDKKGLLILDSSEVQARKLNPQMPVVSNITWEPASTPQVAIPVTIDAHPYIVEMDEFGDAESVGAARIIDIADEKKPHVVSNIRLEVNQPAAHGGAQSEDYGTGDLQDYTGHYCNVPKRVDPGIVACSFILSGLRVFDIRDPFHPKEIAYFNGPIPRGGSAYAMSSPSFVPDRGEIWYSDGNTGFYAVRLTNGVWPFTTDASTAGSAAVPTTSKAGAAPVVDRPEAKAIAADSPAREGALPVTGGGLLLIALALAAVATGLAMRESIGRRSGH